MKFLPIFLLSIVLSSFKMNGQTVKDSIINEFAILRHEEGGFANMLVVYYSNGQSIDLKNYFKIKNRADNGYSEIFAALKYMDNSGFELISTSFSTDRNNLFRREYVYKKKK